MSESPSSVKFTKEIQELYDLVPLLDLHPNERHALIRQIDKLRDTDERRSRILSLVKESLAQIRLDMKYLVFDLEATRRERDALKKDNG